MDIRTIFFTLFVIWKFNKYIPTEYLSVLLKKINTYLKNYNSPDFVPLKGDRETVIIAPKPQVKYEDKYLDYIRKMNKEFKFYEEEEKNRLQKYLDIFKSTNESYREKINEIELNLLNIETKMAKYDGIYIL